MNNYQKHLKAALLVALGYGLGFVIGVVLINLVFDSGLLDFVANLFDKQHLVAGLIVLFTVVFLGGAVAGAAARPRGLAPGRRGRGDRRRPGCGF